MRHRRWAMAAAAAAWLGCAIAGAAPLEDVVRNNEGEQAQIKTRVRQAADDLQAIIAQFEQSGISGQDVDVLKAIQGVLGNLSDKEMTKVLDLLQMARTAADPTTARDGVRQAYFDQTSIIVQLQQLLLEYQRQQELYELSVRFGLLAERQDANLKLTRALVKSLNNYPYNPNRKDEKDALDIQVNDQGALRDETAALLAKLDEFSKEAQGLQARQIKDSLAAATQGGLEDALRSAADDLRSATLFRAGAEERDARDQLYKLAKLIAPDQDSIARLKQADQELDLAIAQQKAVVEGLHDVKPHTFKQQQNADAAGMLEEKQADVVDRTDRTRQDVENVAPKAAQSLKAGEDSMQDTRADINAQNIDPAAAHAQLALNRLEEAKAELEKQLAKDEADKPQGSALAQTQALRDKVAQLKAQQEQLQSATQNDAAKTAELAPQQEDLKQAAQDLQPQALPQSTDAANELGAAAHEMQRAEDAMNPDAMNRAKPADAPAAQQQAVEHLAAAQKALDQRLAELQKAAADLAALEQARKQIGALIQQEQHVDQAVTQAQAAQPATQPDAPPQQAQPDAAHPPELAQQQHAVADQTAQTQANLPPVAQPAQQPLSDAKQNMDTAENALQQQQPAEAQPRVEDAQAKLEEAKTALDNKINDLHQELQEPQQNPENQENAEHKLEDAEQQTQTARHEMPQTPAEQLQEEQQHVADELQHMQAQGEHSPHMQEAQHEAQEAAQHIGNHELPQAVQEMQQAQNDMAQAHQDEQEHPQAEPAATQPAQAEEAHQGEHPEAAHEGEHPEEAHPGEHPEAAHEEGEHPEAAHEGEHQGEHPEEAHQGEHPEAAHEGEHPEAAHEGEHQGEHPEAAHEGEHQGEHPEEAHQGEHPEAAHEGEHQGEHPEAAHEGEHQGEHAEEAHAGAPHQGGPEEAGLPQLQQREAQLQQLAEQMQQQPQTAVPMQQPAEQLENAADKLAEAQAQDDGQIPPTAEQAMTEAQHELNNAAAQAEAGHAEPAQAMAEQAQQAMAQAQQAMEMAQQQTAAQEQAEAAEGQEPGHPGPPHPGQEPGHPGPPERSSSPHPGRQDENHPGGGTGNRQGVTADVVDAGQRQQGQPGASQFLGLPQRDRDAIRNAQSEKYPQEYGPVIEQYMKNLSDQEQQ